MKKLINEFSIEFFRKGEIILSPEGQPAQHLYIIRKGGVKMLLCRKHKIEDARVYDYSDEGDFFGLFSLLIGRPSPLTIIAEEDTICYLLKKEAFKELMENYPDFNLYFTSGPSKDFKHFDTKMKNTDSVFSIKPEINEILFAGRVKDVMHADVLTCPPEETIVGIARKMSNRGVGSAIIVDEHRMPIGILTDNDIRSKLIASGNLANVPVQEIMSRPVKSISPDAFCFEAILSMITDKIKYLTVMDGLKLIGIISEMDLMASQGNNPLAVIKGIQQSTHIDQIIWQRSNIDKSMRIILEHGGMAKDICELITTLNDYQTSKIIMLAEDEMVSERFGKPPVPYAWISLGSEGRREQTMRTDQDNAIIFADVSSPEQEKEVQQYFLTLGEKVVSGLEKSGFPRCKGGYMAINPQWCQSYSVWLKYYRNWIQTVNMSTENIMQTLIFFDFRTIYGTMDFTPGLIECITANLDTGKLFLHNMAETVIHYQPPLGFFKRLVVEKSGEYKNHLNLKLMGLGPLINAVRILALEQKIFETNTIDRINGLTKAGVLSQKDSENLLDAFNVIMLLRVRHHVNQMNEGKEPDNYIKPDDLTIIQRNMLKEAFKTIDRLQELLRVRYNIILL
ncbi:MAG: putative nucleotidyltransferase substrate binding domain-containing protein [Spirochaetota bacterium]